MILAVWAFQVLGEVLMFIHTNPGGKSNRSLRKSEFLMFSLISGRHVGVPGKDTNMVSAY